MKKYLIMALLSSSILMAAQEPIYTVSSSQYFQNQPKLTENESSTHKAVAAKESQSGGQSEIMIITPESRAQDIVSAFQFLRKMSAGTKIAVKLTNGSLLTEIMDMEVMPGGTMIIFKVTTMKGQQYRVEKIENIDTLTNG